jgi:TRAP-type C4-dicarboxylate transport system substrate-binding protein
MKDRKASVCVMRARRVSVMKHRVSMVSVGLVVLLASVLAPSPGRSEAVVRMKFSNFWPAQHRVSRLTEEWARDLERRTNGRVRVTVYHGSSLTPPNRTYEAVVNGACDVGMGALAYTRGRFPLTEVIDLPLGYMSSLQATSLANAYYKKFRPREFDGVKVLFFHSHGPGLLCTKMPVTNLESMRGLKIWSIGVSAKVVQALGGTAVVALPATETSRASAMGGVDGFMAPLGVMWRGWRLGQVPGYSTDNYGSAYATAFFVVMNRHRWNALPHDIQEIVERQSEEYALKYGRMWDETDREWRAFMTGTGHRFMRLPREEDARWAARVRPLLDGYVTDMRAMALPGDQALDFCLSYLRSWQPVQAIASPLPERRTTSPDLVITSVAFSEPSGNNMLDAGEKGSIIVKVKNQGRGEALDVKLKAETVDPGGHAFAVRGLTLTGAVPLGTLRPREEATYFLELKASEEIGTAEVFVRAVLLEGSGFDSQPVLISFKTKELTPPLLRIARIEILDPDGKRVITRGKEVALNLTVQNAGGGAARGVSAAIESGSKEIALLADRSIGIGTMYPGDTKTVSFSVNVTRRYAGPKTLPLSFRLSEERPQFSVSPDIRLALDEEAPDLKVVRVEAKELPSRVLKGGSDPADLDTFPVLGKKEKAFGPDDVAVIIGIEQYRRNLPRSEYSYNDAKVVKGYMEALGIRPANIQYLKNDEATLSDIQKSIEHWLPNRARKESRVFVYYSGHGAPDPATGIGYMVPYDGDPEYMDATGYGVNRLYERLGRLEVKEVIVVMDACFSGAGGRSVIARGVRPLVMMAEGAVLPPTLAVLTASTGGQISASASDKEHGILTYYFLKAVRDGKKSLADIYEYLRPLVEDEAKRQNVEQTPAIRPSGEGLKGRFLLSR